MSILATGVMQVTFSTVSSFAGSSINAVDHFWQPIGLEGYGRAWNMSHWCSRGIEKSQSIRLMTVLGESWRMTYNRNCILKATVCLSMPLADNKSRFVSRFPFMCSSRHRKSAPSGNQARRRRLEIKWEMEAVRKGGEMNSAQWLLNILFVFR
jgi:hypothetical protein